MPATPDYTLAAAVRDDIACALAVVGLGAIALIHLLDTPDTIVAAPYKGWLHVGLIVGSLGAAAALVRSSDPRAWAAAALLSGGAIFAYALSRTVGLPQGADDIGNWSEPLGIAALFVEGSVVALCTGMLSPFSSVSQGRALASAHG